MMPATLELEPCYVRVRVTDQCPLHSYVCMADACTSGSTYVDFKTSACSYEHGRTPAVFKPVSRVLRSSICTVHPSTPGSEGRSPSADAASALAEHVQRMQHGVSRGSLARSVGARGTCAYATRALRP